MNSKYFEISGHNVIALIGNATTKIGDPSDQTKERKKISHEVLQKNADSITRCIKKLFDTHEQEIFVNRGVKELPELKILHNYDWYRNINVIDFFANEGRNFRMGKMLGEFHHRSAHS